VDIYVRLYWLLAAAPEAQPELKRSPCDLLVDGLLASGMAEPLRELYRREIVAHPTEALSARFGQLLDHCAKPPTIFELLEWRWQAVHRLGKYQVIANDVEALRHRLADESEAWCLQLLITAIPYLAWTPRPSVRQLLDRYMKEIERLGRFEDHAGEALERLDFLLEVAAGFRVLSEQRYRPAGLLQLIPVAFTRPADESRAALMGYLEQIAANPRIALRSLDGVHRQAPALLAQFGRLLGALQNELPLSTDAREIEEVTRLVLDFLDSVGRRPYPALRPFLLDFCLREAVTPEEAATHIEDYPANRLTDDQYLSQLVMADGPLRCVCLACRLFWA
jgi:hypothetical protein